MAAGDFLLSSTVDAEEQNADSGALTLQIALVFACGSDGFVNAAAGSVNTMLARIYPDEYGKNHYSELFSGMAYLGTVVGMLLFGFFVDRYGRKYGMLASSCIMIVGSALCAGAYGANGSTQGMFAALIAYRCITGIGIGGEYPSGSTAASENTEEAGVPKRFQHGLFVPLVLYWICGEDHLRLIWRLTFGLGIVPAGLVLLWRLRMPLEPTRYRTSAIKRNVPWKLVARKYWRSFLGVSLCWFLYECIVDTITGGSTKLSTVFAWNVVINAFYLPGTFIGALLVDVVGPKKQLIFFLCCQGTVGFVMSGVYEQLTRHVAGFAILYGVFLSMGEAGPGDCLGLLASKSWPTATGLVHSLAAAAVGKIGAYVGVWAFPAIINDFPEGPKQTSGPFWIGSGLAFLSAIIALLLIPEVPANGMTNTDADFRDYLAANGYDLSNMGLSEERLVEQRDSLEKRESPA
ncbi:hypothetical protein Rhopal_006198-T1 [Rhodotorula paludigena]|uniref:Major facilitator superfamily (MFS) profile domain-containing protein n=1 Tax=Rhodotorula paludigena TaxID=86838 RepID=A0AAV5GKI2_9BASI|nr:hypothetical protein Rhopal_006198-T1 [Rhodotorula paludigena]